MDLNDLLTFARAYRDLGDAAQEQLDDLVRRPTTDLVDGENKLDPNAIDLIEDRLLPTITDDYASQELDDAIRGWRDAYARAHAEPFTDMSTVGGPITCSNCGRPLPFDDLKPGRSFRCACGTVRSRPPGTLTE